MSCAHVVRSVGTHIMAMARCGSIVGCKIITASYKYNLAQSLLRSPQLEMVLKFFNFPSTFNQFCATIQQKLYLHFCTYSVHYTQFCCFEIRCSTTLPMATLPRTDCFLWSLGLASTSSKLVRTWGASTSASTRALFPIYLSSRRCDLV